VIRLCRAITRPWYNYSI